MSKKLVKENQEEAERLHALRGELLELGQSASMHFFRMGEIMKEIRNDELWKVAGCDSFAEFYADPELDYKKSSVYHAIKLVEQFPEWQKFVDIRVSKLIAIAPHVTEENRNELVNQARALSRSDLHHQLRVMRLAKSDKRFESFPKIYPCTVCGKSKGISWEELCHCGWTPKQIKYVKRLINHIDAGGQIKNG